MHQTKFSDSRNRLTKAVARPGGDWQPDARQQKLAAILFAPPEKSAEWIGSAARFGLVEAQFLLGQMLLGGMGVRRDHKAAFAWFTVAANAGHAPAIEMTSRCQENGWGAQADPAMAQNCLQEAAERAKA